MEEVEANQDVPGIEETARLFIRNLPYGATEADLAEAFREHGEVSEVHLVLDRWITWQTLHPPRDPRFDVIAAVGARSHGGAPHP